MKGAKSMRGCTHFLCGGCSKVKSMDQQNVIKTAYTNFGMRSEEMLMFEVHHVQLCNRCFGDAGVEVYSKIKQS